MKYAIIGYSGHAFVVCDLLKLTGQKILGYFEKEEKAYNPYQLKYLGNDRSPEAMQILKNTNWFVAIGNNHLRKTIIERLSMSLHPPATLVHPRATVAHDVKAGAGTLIAAGVIVNAEARIGNGVICNTGSIIEHECRIADYAHIAPGAVLAGNVSVGERSFVGANAVIKEGIVIGSEVRIGAGAVVVQDLREAGTYVGAPAKKIN